MLRNELFSVSLIDIVVYVGNNEEPINQLNTKALHKLQMIECKRARAYKLTFSMCKKKR